VAQDSGSEGQTIRLALSGISSAHQDLIPGYKYYTTPKGDLTLQKNNNKLPFIGIAISDKQLLLNPELLSAEHEQIEREDALP
jgi:hypothetical protein